MKVFLTGGTGLVGAHTALALLERGHQLVLLVRNQFLAEAYFKRHGYDNNKYIVADMCDKPKVKAAMESCDAVVHAAALVSLDPKKAGEVYRTNVMSIDTVLGSACELGIKNILYVSSIAALFQTDIDLIDEQTPLGDVKDAYLKSKRDCEEKVRQLQQVGKPIQITYPVGVLGPDDPKLSESNDAVIAFLKLLVPITSSGIQVVDVRDLAAMQSCLLEHPLVENFENGRYIIAGHYYPWSDFHQLLERVSGKRVFSLKTPGSVLRLTGKLLDGLRKIYPLQSPITHQAMTIVTRWVYVSSAKVKATTGLEFRPAEETLHDTIQWLLAEGHLEAKWAGRLVYSSNKSAKKSKEKTEAA